MRCSQEAREKSDEIDAKTEQEFMADKLLIETSRTSVGEEEHTQSAVRQTSGAEQTQTHHSFFIVLHCVPICRCVQCRCER